MKIFRLARLANVIAFLALVWISTIVPAEAWYKGSALQTFPNPLLSHRTVINQNFLFEYNFAWINHVTPADGAIGPTGPAYAATSLTWPQIIDQNGWLNNSSTGVTDFGFGWRTPATSDFPGPYVATWDGDGQLFLTGGNTWTDSSTTTTAVGNANGTATLSGFSSVVGIAQGFGITGTGVPGSTKVLSVNYSAKTVTVNNNVTTGIGVTFTLTNGTYSDVNNGWWGNTTGGKAYVVFANSTGLSVPSIINARIMASGSTPLGITSMSWSGGIMTVTTAAPHGRPIGYSLSLTFQGATPNSLNTTFNCTMTGASSFTFPLASNPGAVTGTLTYVAFLTNLRIYRQVDEVDGAPVSQGGNGYVFRRPFKQLMVNLIPAAIRFLDWVDGNQSQQVRWENRSLPTKAGAGINWTAGPAYGITAGTLNNYTLAAATGTPTNPNATPASMVHGELAIARADRNMVRAQGTISAISKANPGVVTSTAHGLTTGDQMLLIMATAANAPTGMVELDHVPVTVTVTDADHYSIGINTTTFTTFTGGTAYPYLTMQVGSGNDRTAYPVMQGTNPGSPGNPASFNATAIQSGNYYTWYFDKNIAGIRNAGTLTTASWIKGAWLLGTANDPANGDVPIEYCAALVAEVNVLAKSQGINNITHMWLNSPVRALETVDPDYSTSSDWMLNATKTAMEGGFGLPGLNSVNASVIVEWSNEIWNPTYATFYTGWLSWNRNGGNGFNLAPMHSLRSTIMARNLTANSPYASRIYTTLGMQGIFGYSAGNQLVVEGTTSYFTDPWNTWGSAEPVSFHAAINPGTYFDPTSPYTDTVTGTGTFTDDSAMFNGTNNTSNGGGNYTGAANPTQAIANFIANVQTSTGAGIQSINNYASHASPGAGLIGQYVTAMISRGKTVIGYEGGTDWGTATGSGLNGHAITSADNVFLLAIGPSRAWANAQVQFFNDVATLANTGPFPLYTFLGILPGNQRWAYAVQSYVGGVEWAGLNVIGNSAMFPTLGARNQALPN